MGSHQDHHHQHHHEHHGGAGHDTHHGETPRSGLHPLPSASNCSQTPSSALTPVEKLTKMVEHWLHHNEDHARSFSDWAERARELGQTDVAALIEDAARQSLAQNLLFQNALELLKLAPRKTA